MALAEGNGGLKSYSVMASQNRMESGEPFFSELRRFLNEECQTEIAIITDGSIEMTVPRWPEESLRFFNDERILGICDFRHESVNTRGYRTGFYEPYFAIFNTPAYRKEFMSEWRANETNRKEWPYDQMFGYLSAVPKSEGFDSNLVQNEPGSELWVKVRYGNPNRYLMLDIPRVLRLGFHRTEAGA
jgi:hypothetical protein